ncbi:MAG: hypothetical protein AABY32_00750 [Nanoarchaeota archaeon]
MKYNNFIITSFPGLFAENSRMPNGLAWMQGKNEKELLEDMTVENTDCYKQKYKQCIKNDENLIQRLKKQHVEHIAFFMPQYKKMKPVFSVDK